VLNGGLVGWVNGARGGYNPRTWLHVDLGADGHWVSVFTAYVKFWLATAHCLWARWLSRYSDWLLATGWTVRGSNPGGDEIFRTRPDRPWGPPSLLYNGYRVFPGGKTAGSWC
jgi:hypothetical protein